MILPRGFWDSQLYPAHKISGPRVTAMFHLVLKEISSRTFCSEADDGSILARQLLNLRRSLPRAALLAAHVGML